MKKLNVRTFFLASLAFLTVSVFCIILWSSPTSATVINRPDMNCLKKFDPE